MSDSFNMLERILHAANARHAVIAANISNADTPNYKARDIKFENLLNSATMEMAKTNKKHMVGGGSGLPGEISSEVTQPWADRNNVEVDMEVSKMTENAMLYQAGVTMLAKKISMYKTALRR